MVLFYHFLGSYRYLVNLNSFKGNGILENKLEHCNYFLKKTICIHTLYITDTVSILTMAYI